MGSINTDPYHHPSHRANHLRELDGFTYADGTRIHRGDSVAVDGAPLTVIGFDPAHDGVIVRGLEGVMTVRTGDVQKPARWSAETGE